MAVIAMLGDEKAIEFVLPWASAFASARKTSLTIVCWTQSPVVNNEGAAEESEALVRSARDFSRQAGLAEPPEVIGVCGPSLSAAAISVARREDAELVVAAADDPTGARGASYSTNPLLKQSPCNTVILFGDSARSTEPGRIFVAASDSSHDEAALFLASGLASSCDARVTLARAELEAGQQGLEVGRRELKQLMRNSGVDDSEHLDCRVFETGDREGVTRAMDEHDLVLVGANNANVPAIVELATRPTVAVIKRAPPLRPWQMARRSANWNPRISPSDYAELVQGLRHGSRLGADFVTMLGLATVVASIGLLQDSAAVVIGSMLLAPLMTPMIGCGLALAQANQKLGRMALGTVAVGLVCTLAISFLIGVVAPGAELTPQIYARGEPTVLDLFVALASGAAAAYALARPNLVGSIAGVAIATALVPPLCSVGLSVAYRDLANAQGAALLFVTNFLAIVLAAALTFRLIGITVGHARAREKFWAFRAVGVLGIAAILVCVPLQHAMLRSLVEAKPRPRAFPLAKAVVDALEERLEAHPNASLISAGQPSSDRVPADVVLVLGATSEVDPGFADELVEIVRRAMQDEELVVDVHCVSARWQERSQ